MDHIPGRACLESDHGEEPKTSVVGLGSIDRLQARVDGNKDVGRNLETRTGAEHDWLRGEEQDRVDLASNDDCHGEGAPERQKSGVFVEKDNGEVA